MEGKFSAKSFWTEEEAKKYDKSSAIRKTQIEMTTRLVDEIGLRGKILDIGCGTGFSLEILKNVIGLDISKAMLNIARKKGFKKLIRGDFSFLPFKDKNFDRIFSVSTLQWTEGETRDDVRSNYRNLCKELNRILAKDGKIGLQFYPCSEKEFEIFRKELKKFFDGYTIEEGKGKKVKKYIILERN